MKKLFVLAAIVLLGASTVSAQSFGEMFGKNKKSSISFGVRAGINFSDLTMKMEGLTYDFDARTGFQAGGIVDIPLFNGFYIQPGLFVTTRGARQELHKETMKINSTYLDIPVLASFRGDVCNWCNLQFNVGPYLGVGLGGKIKEEEIGEITYKYDFFGKTEFDATGDKLEERGGHSRFDMGLSFGVGATFKKHWYVGFQYDLGLTNIALCENGAYIDGTKIKNGNFAIQVGYNF